MPFKEGPYIQVACFCENVIKDDTGALSIIRIIDTLTSQAKGPEPPEEMPPVNIQLKLVLAFKSGTARGRYNLKIVPELPNGSTKDPMIMSVHFDGEEKGANVISNIPFAFEMEGLYWFIVYLDDERFTALPFRIKYSRIVVGSKPPDNQ